MIKIRKRDGRIERFNSSKISSAVERADKDRLITMEDMDNIINDVYSKCIDLGTRVVDIEIIHSFVEDSLKARFLKVFNSYHNYREERAMIRIQSSELIKTVKKFQAHTDRDNANVGNNFSSKLLRIASETNKVAVLGEMPKELAKLHMKYLYYHDLDSYNLTPNCLHIDTYGILKDGFNTGYGYIKCPQRIESAAELSCILLQSSQNK